MNAHERALELGAATVDFHLTADERATLDRHLASCLACRSDINGMTDDARRIAARPVTHLSPEAAAAVRASIERPRRGTSLSMVLAAATLLLLAAIAAATVGAQLERRLDQSRLGVVPAPSAAPLPSGGPSQAPLPAGPTAWTMTSLGTVPGIPFQAVAVAGSDLGWIAIGERSCVENAVRNQQSMYDCAATVARSADGRTWVTSGTIPYATNYVGPTSGPEAGVVDVAGGPDGYVAVGYTRDGGAKPVMAIPDGAAWWSADGVTWERALLGDGARPATVFRAPDRWLIGGVVYRGFDLQQDRPIGAVWTSSDGRTWTRIEDDAVFDVGGYVDTMEDPGAGGIGAFAWDGEAIVAGGHVCAEGGVPCSSAAWVSSDGSLWDRVENLPAGNAITDVEAVNGTFIAAAGRCPESGACSTVALRSEDGLAWEEVLGGLSESAAVTVADGTAILVSARAGLGDTEEALDVRASADGSVWTLLGSVGRPNRTNWGVPVLVPHADGSVDLLVRMDPVTDPDTEADASTEGWTIAPAP